MTASWLVTSTVVVMLAVLGVSDVGATVSPQNRTNCQSGAPVPPNRVNTTERLAALREQMTNNSLDAYVVVMTDEHGSYSGTGHYAMVAHMSGLSASNGWAVVTHNKSAVWTDGRYFKQADDQMDCNWILMQMGTWSAGETGYPQNTWDWLKDELNPGDRVGAYPNFVDQSTWSNHERELTSAGFKFVAVENELVGEIWTSPDRPEKPNNPLIIHNISFAGRSWQDKLGDIRSEMRSKSVDVLVVTVLEQVAWLFNLRGSDKSNSLFYGYSIVYNNRASLYLSNYTALLSQEALRAHLEVNQAGQCNQPSNEFCVNVYEYNDIYDNIAALPAGERVWVDPTANYAIFNATSHLAPDRIVEASPIELIKSIKNGVERSRFRDCIFRDSAAVIEFAQFLENRIKQRGETNWTEINAAAKLLSVRQSFEHFQGVSFETIAAFGANAAVIHYRADETTDAQIGTSNVFLLDSGGQYLDGTTDVTRTFHYGTPTNEVKEAYTRVLMGQIDLALAVWPAGLYGYELDAIARQPLHRYGWDYNHGTGHGIGYWLSVHEGPGRIARGYNPAHKPIYEGMFFSDEPGFYKDNDFGIRLENLVTVVKANTTNQFGNNPYLTFDTLTLVPYETNLIKYELLTNLQKEWLNKFNEQCRTKMGDEYLMTVRNNHAAHQWVLDRTDPIPIYVGGQGHLTSGLLTTVLLPVIASLSRHFVA